MHKYINKLFIASLAVAAASCTGAYEDINSNPYEPGDLSGDSYKMNSQLNNVASCVMSSDVNTIQFTDALLGGVYGGYFSDSNAGFAESFARYNPKDDWSRVFLMPTSARSRQTAKRPATACPCLWQESSRSRP